MAFLPESDLERMRFFAVKELIKALRENKLSAEQLPAIAKEILEETDNANTPEKLTGALAIIGTRHDVLMPIATLYESYVGEQRFEQSAEKLTQLLKDGNLEEAQKLAQTIHQE